MTGVTGNVISEAEFDRSIMWWLRWVGSGILVITVVGIALIPFWWLFSLWYGPEYLRRVSATLTAQALEVRVGVFFRKEATIPLDRITDLRLHDDPVMRFYGLRGLKVETAGSAGQNAGSEGNLIGVINAEAFRNAVLAQRQRVVDAETGRVPAVASAEADAPANATLLEIRDILARIEGRMAQGDGG